MHYTNMKAAENCCISSCNLLSQRHFNGNLSHSFQIHFHLLYKMTSAPVSVFLSLCTIFGGLNIPLNNFISTWPRPHQLAGPGTTQLHRTAARSRLRLGPSPCKLRLLSSHSLIIRVSMPNAFRLLEPSQCGGPDNLLYHFASLEGPQGRPFQYVSAVISRSFDVFTFNHLSGMNGFQEDFLLTFSDC